MLLKKRVQLPPQPGQVVVIKDPIMEINKKAYHASHSFSWSSKKRTIHLKETYKFLVLRHFPGTDKMFYALPIEHTDYKNSTGTYGIEMLQKRARRKCLLLSSDATAVVESFDDFLNARYSNEPRKDRYINHLLDLSKVDRLDLTFM